MSFESRLKTSLESDARVPSPDVTAALDSVLRRHRSRRRVRVTAYSVAAIAAIAAIAIAVPRVIDVFERDPTVPAAHDHGPSIGPGYSEINGVYTTRINERPGVVRTYHLEGRWTMRLTEDGSVSLDASPSFEDLLGPVADATFNLTSGRLRTNVMFHDGLGCTTDATYAWAVNGPTLRLTEIDDDCPYRPAVLGSVWIRRDNATE